MSDIEDRIAKVIVWNLTGVFKEDYAQKWAGRVAAAVVSELGLDMSYPP